MHDACKTKKVTTKGVSYLFVNTLANVYLKYDHLSLKSLASSFGLSAAMASDILYRGIAEDILADPIAEQIYNKIVHSSKQDVQRRAERWDRAFEERNEFRESRKSKKTT